MSAPCSTSSATSRSASADVGRILLVGPAIAAERGGDGLAEGAIERRRVLHGIGEDRHIGGSRCVQRVPDCPDLAVHHAAGSDQMGASCRMQYRHLGVDLDGCVIVDRTRGSEHAAVSMIGELVETDIRHDQARVADLLAHRPNGCGQDAIRIERPGAARILVLGDAEEHDARQPCVGGFHRRLAERIECVLNDAGHGADRARLTQTFRHEHGQDQLARFDAGLANHGSHSRRGPQAPRSVSNRSLLKKVWANGRRPSSEPATCPHYSANRIARRCPGRRGPLSGRGGGKGGG